MLDLEHLDALDDDTPPEPDLASARVRARRLRARHRWTAVAAAVVLLVGAAVAVAALRGDNHTVQVVGPSVMPAGLSARLELPQTSYPSGYSVTGSIVFVNGTGAPIDYTIDCQQTPPWQVILSKNGVLFFVPQAAVGCAENSGTTALLAPGETRIPFYLGLGYPACGSSGEPEPAMPRCTGDPPGIPDLAPARYQIVFRGTGAPFKSLDVPPLEVV